VFQRKRQRSSNPLKDDIFEHNLIPFFRRICYLCVRMSYQRRVCPSVCLSVCHTLVLSQK